MFGMINVSAPWKLIATAPRDGTRIVVYRPGEHREPIGIDLWRDNAWWHSRPGFPPAFWCTVDEIKPKHK